MEIRRKRLFLLNHDPNNKAWSEDTSRFGFKMLEKMGWESGNGLGRAQQGRNDNLKVKPMERNRGVGAVEHYKERTKDALMQKTLDFSSLLKKLSGEYKEGGNGTFGMIGSMSSSDESDSEERKKVEKKKKKKKMDKSKSKNKKEKKEDEQEESSDYKMSSNHLITLSKKKIDSKRVKNYSNNDLAAIMGNSVHMKEYYGVEENQEEVVTKKHKHPTGHIISKIDLYQYFRNKMVEYHKKKGTVTESTREMITEAISRDVMNNENMEEVSIVVKQSVVTIEKDFVAPSTESDESNKTEEEEDELIETAIKKEKKKKKSKKEKKEKKSKKEKKVKKRKRESEDLEGQEAKEEEPKKKKKKKKDKSKKSKKKKIEEEQD